MKLPLLCLTSLLLATVPSQGQPLSARDVPELRPVKTALPRPLAFGWSEDGTLWSLHAAPNRELRLAGGGRVINLPGKLSPTSSFLVDSNVLYLPQGRQIRRFGTDRNLNGKELAPLLPPADLFSAETSFSSLAWGPEGFLYFSFNGPTAPSNGVARGIGRLNLAKNKWDYFVEGLESESSWGFAPDGQAFLADRSSGAVYHLHPGIAYSQFRNYPTPGLVADVVPPLLPATRANPWKALAFWPVSPGPTRMIVASATGQLQSVILEPETNGSSFRATASPLWDQRAATLEKKGHTFSQIAVGPDLLVYLLSEPDRQLFQMLLPGPDFPVGLTNLAALKTSDLVNHLTSSSFWHRRTAQRILWQRRDLPNSRGLHPPSALHKMLRESTNAQDRLEALWALSAVGLMEHDILENQETDKDPNVLYWLGRMVGDRGFPFGQAFLLLDHLGTNENHLVRSGSLIGIRQFNSSNLVMDRDPFVPIREVWTGGNLSTHWWRVTKNSSDPVLNLQYWQAVRPITGFDPSHPMGFFQGDNTRVMPYAAWLLARMTHQFAQTSDAEKFEAGMEAMGKYLEVTKSPLVVEAGLEGLLVAEPLRKVEPGCVAREVMEKFARAEQPGVAERARRVLRLWETANRRK